MPDTLNIPRVAAVQAVAVLPAAPTVVSGAVSVRELVAQIP
jgi:hypothetical protein